MPRPLVVALVALAALAFTPAARAADPAAVAAARRALQAGVDSAAAGRILAARARFKALSDAEPGVPLLHYWVAVADWRLVPLLGRGDRARAERYCREGVAECDALLKLDGRSAEALALKGGLQGLLLGFDPSAMMTLGPEAALNLSRARELDPESPRAWLLDGMSTFHKPAEFGGGPAPALDKLRRAQALYGGRGPAEGLAPDWGVEDAFIWAGQAARELGDLDTARAMFRKALEAAPRNAWVREALLPAVSGPREADGKP